MKILFVTQWFDPEPIFKGLVFAKALRDRGHEVQVLTGFPNYPEGRLYPGYRLRLLQRELLDGVEVLRVPLYPSHDSSTLRRVANYVSFALSAAILGPWIVRRANVMYVYHPPATVALPAVVIGVLRGIPFVYDIQDLWPDTLAATGMVRSRAILSLAAWWCRVAYRMASRIVVLSRGFKRILVERGARPEKVEVIYNWCDEGSLERARELLAPVEEIRTSRRFHVVFAGNVGKAQALETVLQAAATVKAVEPCIRFVIVGGGTEARRLEELARTMGVDNVVFQPRRAISEMGAILGSADVLLVHLKDEPLFAVTIPSKTQAYMAAGKPILMAVRGDAADLVERAGAGVVCSPEDSVALAAKVIELYRSPKAALDTLGENGREFYRRELSMAVAVDHFESVFRSVAGEPAGWRT